MEIHVIAQLNVAHKTIEPFAHVQLVISVIHSTIAIWSPFDKRHNVFLIQNVLHPRHVSIKCVKIHVLNAIHVSKTRNAVLYNTIQLVIAQPDGLAIHRINATNVRLPNFF